MASTPDVPAAGPPREAAGDAPGYELGEVLREGWAGTIRAARYGQGERPVTVQEVRPDLVASPGVIDRLGTAGATVAELRDPHLLALYDVVEEADGYRLVAEWSDAPALATLGDLPGDRTVAVVDSVLAGLEALHAAGTVHGHVAPETVVVDGEHARLAELGICAAAFPEVDAREDVRAAARLGRDRLRGTGDRATAAVLADAARGSLTAAELRGRLTAARQGAPARPRRRRRLVVAVALALLAIAAGVVAGLVMLSPRPAVSAPGGRLAVGDDANLAVSPASGGCDTTFVFVGRGSLAGTGTLVYRWEQSDGEESADVSLPIAADEGSFQLTQAWRLQGSQSVDGTMTLHILRPTERRLSRGFRYGCP